MNRGENMHIKRIHEMIEKLTEVALCELEKGSEYVNTSEFGEVIDMIKDLSEAEYKSRISKAMEEAEEDDKAEEKYIMKRFKEEYGDEEGERRFYDDYRYKRSGRFAPKGRGSYMPRKAYEEPMYHMTPEMYREHDPEWYRDIDRNTRNIMYYTDTKNMGNEIRDSREGRSWKSRKTYMETKELHSGNTPEDKQHKMRELEKYLSELGSDISEMIANASNEERALAKQKLQVLAQKM